jgi:lipid II:glycine glycyltransferase (peptidoglycan interpeptide bridge formation enzyme)
LTGGLVFCRVKSWLTGARLVSLPFSDHCEPLTQTNEELQAIVQQLKRLVTRENWSYFEVRPTAPQALESVGFHPASTYLLHAVDLSRDRDTIFRSLHKDCVQRKIRRAERESLEYHSGNSEELLLKFYQLLIKTRRRHGLPPQPKSWFRHLSRSFGEKLQFRVASHQGAPVAAILTLKHRETITYKYGASDSQWNKLGGTALLFWRTIEEAKAEGMRQLELGRSDPNNQGLIEFKNHWSTESSSLNYWRYSSRGARAAGEPKALPRNVVERAPDWALCLLGKLLYPHIG